MRHPLLRVSDVGWRVGDASILEGVSFDARSGEFVALMGRNGAGKSTLLDIIAGLRRPTSGSVAVEGRVLDAWAPGQMARLVAHLPQMIRADMACSVEQLVAMGRYPHAMAWFESEEDGRIVHDALERCDGLAFQHRTLGTLSGGERQRILLAACLAQQPRLLLLDEPATFLDVEQQLHCFSILRDEADRGTSCVAVTHDLNLALTFCTRLVVLDRGRIVRDVSVARALDDQEWLSLLSPRLRATMTPSGRPWVWYE